VMAQTRGVGSISYVGAASYRGEEDVVKATNNFNCTEKKVEVRIVPDLVDIMFRRRGRRICTVLAN
jgi:hypothetical protein